MKSILIKTGMIIYLLLFAYILIFKSLSIDNTETKIFFLLSPLVLYFGLRNSKILEKK
ncbi:hypothetical protein [Fulvivirga sedimenti]|uniref:Uncharacterized protein n=1 Tax=Fulvivirga sedimenti TaxID=2879465 RepID=A0A9X1HUL5_9BACT|nr:hypothetical protein [Fulvivirga sedimenti]MCA6075028.1 hypothetical protein [Fulvivirga sedimenti]MCA6076205.1 hypothetical protein [Fulvivirga sedimenti]MCA6077333.1 hypothetical protein [Fulvivirga sedimenti]